jgi:hypothetical protein
VLNENGMPLDFSMDERSELPEAQTGKRLKKHPSGPKDRAVNEQRSPAKHQ